MQLTSPEQLWVLASGVHPGIRVGTSYAIKSDLDDGLWYVGATVYHVPKGELDVATWLVTGSKSNPGLVLSVDSAAQALSLWPSAQSRFPVSEADPEVWTLLTTLKE